jgi:endonuclease YncB( thermonuclease family)
VTIDIRGVDQYGRLLAKVQLADGRDVGQVLILEHLARPYQEGQRPNWC